MGSGIRLGVTQAQEGICVRVLADTAQDIEEIFDEIKNRWIMRRICVTGKYLFEITVENNKGQEKILFSLAPCHPCRIPFFKPSCEKSHQYRNQIIHKDKYISKPGFLKQKGPDCCQYI